MKGKGTDILRVCDKIFLCIPLLVKIFLWRQSRWNDPLMSLCLFFFKKSSWTYSNLSSIIPWKNGNIHDDNNNILFLQLLADLKEQTNYSLLSSWTMWIWIVGKHRECYESLCYINPIIMGPRGIQCYLGNSFVGTISLNFTLKYQWSQIYQKGKT